MRVNTRVAARRGRQLASCAVLGFALPTGAVRAQSTELASPGTRLVIQSAVLDQERVIWVWTPPGYSANRPGLPVMYLLDPDVHFEHVTGMVQFLGYYLRAPEMIVVGVLNRDRGADLSPRRPDGTGGRFDDVLRFITGEVQPLIARSYRTAPFSILVGHSSGGLAVVHAAFTQPAGFAAYFAVSPSLDWADSLVLRTARRELEAGRVPRFLYLALSGTERPGITATTDALANTLAATTRPALEFQSDSFPAEHHLTVPLPAFHAGMRWLFADWATALAGVTQRLQQERSLAALDEAFARLSVRYGYGVHPAEIAFSILGDRLYQARAWDVAIKLFSRRVSLYPESPEAHDELARGYLAAGRRTEAIASFERAVALAEAQHHHALSAIRERLASARESR
jgi:hypothetical protein